MKLNALLFEAKHRNRTLELGPADVLSVSGEHGCVNQIEFMGRSYAGVTVKDYHVVENGDIVYTKSPLKRNPYQNRTEAPRCSRRVEMEKIEKNDFNLNISRYISTAVGEEEISL